MTVRDKILEEIGCAIYSVLGDEADKEYDNDSIDRATLIEIARKTAWYLDK